MQRDFSFPVLYDGVSALRAAPLSRVTLPPEAAIPSCVLLSASLVANSGELFVENAGQLAISGAGYTNSRQVTALTAAATQVLRESVNQDVFSPTPDADGRFIVAIPLWASHPLFAQPVSASRAASGEPASVDALPTLSEHGWPEAERLGQRDGVVLYLLARREHRMFFGVVRQLDDEQPLIDVTDTVIRGRHRQTYGPVATTRFHDWIVEQIPPNRFAGMEIEVWHYAEDFHADRAGGTPYASKRHPLSGSESVEPPIAVERWSARRVSSSEPFRWFAGSERAGVGDLPYNSLAEIRERQEAMLARERQYASARHEREQREVAARATRVQAQRAADAERARAYASVGLVYLGPDYWAGYENGREMRAVFDGDFPDAEREWEFGQIYQRVVSAFYARCRAHVPDDSPRQIITEIELDEFGNHETVRSREEILIRKDWALPYVWWDEDDPRAPALLPSELSLSPSAEGVSGVIEFALGAATGGDRIYKGAATLIRFVAGLREDMPKLFSQGCMSPMLTQFQENMRRIALGLPTLQAELVPDSLRDWAESPQTLEGACSQYIREGGFSVGREWCPCLASVFETRTTVGERWTLLEDYTRFFRMVDTPPNGGPNDPGWQYYEPANQCRR